MTRAELDSRKTAPVYNKASNPFVYLAEILNDYDEFCPHHNVMVEFMLPEPNQCPVLKKYHTNQVRWNGHI
jgi:hypothetical protein